MADEKREEEITEEAEEAIKKAKEEAKEEINEDDSAEDVIKKYESVLNSFIMKIENLLKVDDTPASEVEKEEAKEEEVIDEEVKEAVEEEKKTADEAIDEQIEQEEEKEIEDKAKDEIDMVLENELVRLVDPTYIDYVRFALNGRSLEEFLEENPQYRIKQNIRKTVNSGDALMEGKKLTERQKLILSRIGN